MGLLEYLKEKEEYFYPEEEKEELEDSVEAEDDYGYDFVDDETFDAEHIEVEEIPDNSDPILNADEFMKPNSELQKFYASGKGFDITDNQDLYEVVKLVKDMTDKHLYMRDMTWKVDIANRKANFIFKVASDDIEEVDDFFLNGVQQYIVQEMFKKFGPLYNVDTKQLKDNEGNRIMEMTVEKNNDEERMDIRKISFNSPESNSFVGQRQSVSKM